MHILAIVDKVMGEINTVIDSVTGEKKEYQHLIKDPQPSDLGFCNDNRVRSIA